MPRAFVFDAYGTLFDVHAAVSRHRDAAGPEADRFSEVWRTKQLEYAWILSATGHYLDFWTLTERALDHAFARFPTVDRALRAALLDCYFKLDAFPDSDATLKALKAHPPAELVADTRIFSVDGTMPADGPGNVLDTLKAAEPGSDWSKIDLKKTYDNAYVKRVKP